MIFKSLKNLSISIFLLAALSPLGACELYLLSLVDGEQLSAEETAFFEQILNNERKRFNQNNSEFNEMTNSQANANIYKDPRNFLTYSNPGFNADHLTKNTYPGIFCNTGSNVASSFQGFPFSNHDINDVRSFLQSNGVSNPSLAQITSICGGF